MRDSRALPSCVPSCPSYSARLRRSEGIWILTTAKRFARFGSRPDGAGDPEHVAAVTTSPPGNVEAGAKGRTRGHHSQDQGIRLRMDAPRESVIVATSTPLTHEQRGSLGGRARAERLTPERRREIARTAHLASAVKAVVDRAPELTEAQKTRLAAIFGPGQAV